MKQRKERSSRLFRNNHKESTRLISLEPRRLIPHTRKMSRVVNHTTRREQYGARKRKKKKRHSRLLLCTRLMFHWSDGLWPTATFISKYGKTTKRWINKIAARNEKCHQLLLTYLRGTKTGHKNVNERANSYSVSSARQLKKKR